MAQIIKKLFAKNRFSQLFLVLLLLLLFISIAATLRISHIECLVEEKVDKEFCTQLNFLNGKSLFFTNLERTALFQQVLTNELEQVYMPLEVKRELPNKLVIKFIREDPLYRLEFEDQTYLVNSKHYLATDSDEFKLPLITLAEAYGQFIDQDKIDPEQSKKLYTLADSLQQLQVNFEQVYFDGSESYVKTDQAEFLFSDQDDYRQLALNIFHILEEFSKVTAAAEDGQKVVAIDMRFDAPLVIFE